jgi:hypothetical protein
VKRDIREVDSSRGIICITTQDERFYARRVNENSAWDFVPSVTWICDSYPKGRGYYMWLARHGWDEAEEIRRSAGDKGSKVHQAAGVLLSGGTVRMEDSFENPRTLEKEPLTPDEYLCLMSFCEWFAEEQPQVIAVEYTVWNEKLRYAGTVDLKCRLKSDYYRHVWIIDLKTSAEIWPPMELQVSAYKHADESPKANRLAILQLGYRRNKNKKFKFTQIPDQFHLFRAAQRIWFKQSAGVSPKQMEYPLSLSLGTVSMLVRQEEALSL